MRVTKAGHMMWVHEIPGDSIEGRPYSPIVINLGTLTARLSGVICPDPSPERTFRAESEQVVDRLLRTVGVLGVGPECMQGVRLIIGDPAPGEFGVLNEVYGGAVRAELVARGLPTDLLAARAAHESGLPDPTIPARIEAWADVALPPTWMPPATWEVRDLGALPPVR